MVYPRRHRLLHQQVGESGLVLSELPPGTQPLRWSFPARNRIMAGLARMTVVVEAADPSGSLITSDFARDLGRCVAAVPGQVTSTVARGTNGLLRDGAVPVTGTEDVLDELFGVGHASGAAAPSRPPRCPTIRACGACWRRPSDCPRCPRSPRTPALEIRRDPRRARAARGRGAPRPARALRLGARAGAYPARPMSDLPPPPKVLSIAGSDSGGGAGIQADLKAFARCGVHGMTAITAITAQNTVAVTAVYPLPAEAIVEQVRAVAEDIGVDAVKIGMLGSAETIEAVVRALDLVGDAPVVLDPVMVAESGARLLDEDAEHALRSELLPRVTVVTPNLPEARVLAAAGEAATPERARPGDPRARAGGGGGHRRPPRGGDRPVLRRRAARRDPRRAPPRRRRARLGLHPLLGAGGAAGAGPRAARGRAPGQARSPREAVRDGLRGLGAGAGPVDVLGIGSRSR